MDIANIVKSPWEKLLQLFISEQYFICTFVAENLCPQLIASVLLAVPGAMFDQDCGMVVFMLEALVRR